MRIKKRTLLAAEREIVGPADKQEYRLLYTTEEQRERIWSMCKISMITSMLDSESEMKLPVQYFHSLL